MEIALLNAIIDENINVYPFLRGQLNILYVKKRENTGVGIYSDFGYIKEIENSNINTLISANKTLYIQGLENEVNYVLDISQGKMCSLEIVTNGNDLLNKNTFDFNFKIV